LFLSVKSEEMTMTYRTAALFPTFSLTGLALFAFTSHASADAATTPGDTPIANAHSARQ
jgi:hypothetical protein